MSTIIKAGEAPVGTPTIYLNQRSSPVTVLRLNPNGNVVLRAVDGHGEQEVAPTYILVEQDADTDTDGARISDLIGRPKETVIPALPGLTDQALDNLAAKDTRGWLATAILAEMDRRTAAARTSTLDGFAELRRQLQRDIDDVLTPAPLTATLIRDGIRVSGSDLVPEDTVMLVDVKTIASATTMSGIPACGKEVADSGWLCPNPPGHSGPCSADNDLRLSVDEPEAARLRAPDRNGDGGGAPADPVLLVDRATPAPKRKPRGWCLTCGCEFSVNKGGGLAEHSRSVETATRTGRGGALVPVYTTELCPGAGTSPLDHIPTEMERHAERLRGRALFATHAAQEAARPNIGLGVWPETLEGWDGAEAEATAEPAPVETPTEDDGESDYDFAMRGTATVPVAVRRGEDIEADVEDAPAPPSPTAEDWSAAGLLPPPMPEADRKALEQWKERAEKAEQALLRIASEMIPGGVTGWEMVEDLPDLIIAQKPAVLAERVVFTLAEITEGTNHEGRPNYHIEFSGYAPLGTTFIIGTPVRVCK